MTMLAVAGGGNRPQRLDDRLVDLLLVVRPEASRPQDRSPGQPGHRAVAGRRTDLGATGQQTGQPVEGAIERTGES